jgi:hypothetical protein
MAWSVLLLAILPEMVADTIAIFINKAAPRCVAVIIADTITVFIDKTATPFAIGEMVADTIAISIGEAGSLTLACAVITEAVTVFIDKTLSLTAAAWTGSLKSIHPVSKASRTITHPAPLTN